MAQQQPYQVYQATQKGTLVPGQSISVNKFSVQVERYLTQGGFAHVYLVRTAVPVYNTTHHVLKRIAVPSEAMLSEVKKEVDIMRILKGHPNIVHLIDAAWHRMPTGVYEVFILMEFCPGGGIIDMMNRRLRERLTESEILQIFVDVCEGLAAMHNLRPPLLHRDLKVENILQSTPTAFKLCDFGSATSVSQKPPASTAEIRALESDLNRHTTLQYRAPEMVDPYLRRPVDEKSDVWALGVLLYKLCYYTTPFEEHGPLAILNVQYRIPPYPIYSSQMNALIASMLREYGAQRPSVFEILAHVHVLRGTKSRFTYTIPSPQPLSPRHELQFSSLNPLENTVQYRSNVPNAGVQAREKVLEAIAPMRRGRPNEKDKDKDETQENRKGRALLGDSEERKSWNASAGLRGHKSGVVSSSAEAWKASSPKLGAGIVADDAWDLRGGGKVKKANEDQKDGFGDDFAAKLWTSSAAGAGSNPDVTPLNVRPPESSHGTKVMPSNKSKDAFDGLGLSVSDKTTTPTLGEARKFRTGLAVVNGYNHPSGASPSSSPQPPSVRPSSSPRPTQFPLSNPPSRPITSTQSTPIPSSSQPHRDGLPVEARFPSLEVLDATFSSSPSSTDLQGHSTGQPKLHVPSSVKLSVSPSLPPRSSNFTGGLRPVAQTSLSHDGVRSEQVTGIAMRSDANKRTQEPTLSTSISTSNGDNMKRSTITRPALSRKHRSSTSIKRISPPNVELLDSSVLSSTAAVAALRSPRKEQKDWLTGTDDEASTAATTSSFSLTNKPVMRGSPEKRASYLENSPTSTNTQEAIAASYRSTSRPRSPIKNKITRTGVSHMQPSVNKETIAPLGQNRVKENWSPVRSLQSEMSSSDEHEGPEDVQRYVPPRVAGKQRETRRRKGRGRQSSVHDLVDLWGGGVGTPGAKEVAASHSPVSVISDSTTDAKSPTRSATMQPLPGLTSSSKVRSSSPQEISTSLATPATPSSFTAGHRKNPSKTNNLSPKSPRSARPQSMFIFPVSRAKSDGTPVEDGAPSPGLSPPIDQVPKRLRRTSISDMVQRYEAIGGKASPTVVAKTAVMKGNAQTTSSVENGRYTRATIPKSPVTPRPAFEDTPSAYAQRSSPRTSPGGRREEGGAMRNARYSPSKPTTLSVEPSSLEPSFSSQKPVTPTQGRPPSPDKPYQGVGKLIDQWQRKTADADPYHDPRRGGPVSKRTGLVNDAR